MTTVPLTFEPELKRITTPHTPNTPAVLSPPHTPIADRYADREPSSIDPAGDPQEISTTEESSATDMGVSVDELINGTNQLINALARYADHVNETFFPHPGCNSPLPPEVMPVYSALYERIFDDSRCDYTWDTPPETLVAAFTSYRALGQDFLELTGDYMNRVYDHRNNKRYQTEATEFWLCVTHNTRQTLEDCVYICDPADDTVFSK